MAPPTDDEAPPPDDTGASNSQITGQSGMMNGPSGNDERPWERPWTLAEMRKSAKDWSLAGDAGMLHYLQEFSQKMISRTHEIQQQVDGLIHESKLTGVRVNNAFIDFIMLANTQFVENRVYDEDVAQEENAQEEKKDNKEKTREEREAELIPKISQALTLGLNVIDRAFEKLDVNEVNSDSEEEEDASYKPDPILEPKDPYITRALPYLIGSQAFMQDDDVGLVDLPSDVEEEDQGTLSETESSSEEDSDEERRAAKKAGRPYESDSESEYSSSVETDSSSSEEEVERKPRKKKKSGSDLFGKGSDSEEVDSGSDEDALAPAKSAKPLGFADELASKIRAPAAPREDVEEQQEPEKPEKRRKDSGKKEKHKAKVKKKVDEDNLFGPPEDEDEDDSSPFGKKGGLFSSGGGLFDDDGDQGGLFDDITEDKPKKKTKEVKSKDPDSESGNEVEEEVKKAPQEPVSRGRTKSGKKMPAGAVSIFGGGDDELFGPSKDESEEEEEPITKPKAKSISKTTGGGGGVGGLFDDDEGEDLFAETVSSKKPAAKKAVAKPSKPAVDLFGGEDEDDEGDLFSETSVQKTAKPSKEEDLFAEGTPKESKPVEKPKGVKSQKKLPPGAVSMFGAAPNPLVAAIKSQRPPSDEDEGEKSEEEKSEKSSGSKSSASARRMAGQRERSASLSSNSLFADEPEDDLFSSKPKPASSKPDIKAKSKLGGGGGRGLFEDDGGDGDDLFAGLPSKKPAENKKGSQTKPKSSGLFLDEEEGEGDLFGTTAPKAEPSKKKPTGGVALFGGADLFGDSKKPHEDKVEEKKEEVKPTRPKDLPKKEEPAPRKNTLSLFDKENDEDLFSGVGEQKAKPPQAKTGKSEAAGKEDQVPHKPRTRSVMLFEDEDVLFGAAEENPSVDLFGSQSPLSPTEQNKPFPGELESDSNVKSTDPSTVSIGGATTTASSTDLFGSNEDDDDLFSITKKAVPRKALSSSHGKVSLGGATTTESSSDLFGDKTGGSLFSQQENTAQVSV